MVADVVLAPAPVPVAACCISLSCCTCAARLSRMTRSAARSAAGRSGIRMERTFWHSRWAWAPCRSMPRLRCCHCHCCHCKSVPRLCWCHCHCCDCHSTGAWALALLYIWIHVQAALCAHLRQLHWPACSITHSTVGRVACLCTGTRDGTVPASPCDLQDLIYIMSRFHRGTTVAYNVQPWETDTVDSGAGHKFSMWQHCIGHTAGCPRHLGAFMG